MARWRAVASTVVVAILSYGGAARAQSFACGSVGLADADPPLDAELIPPAQPSCCPPPATTPCTHCQPSQCAHCRLLIAPPDVTEDELEAVLIGGVSAAALGYLVANVIISQQPHRTPTIDGIPVFGAIWSVAHNQAMDRTTPLLLFSAGVQAIGLLVTVAAATELHDLRRLGLDFSASAQGAGVTYTWRY
ncbi:MAG TPA: hypothetical protein VGL86_15790 [Polyangia bacterium]|jgi:hypothetical protein